MNRNTYLALLKGLLVFVFFTLQIHAFSVTYFTNKSGTIAFNNVNNWNSSQDGTGFPPSTSDVTGNTGNNFVIQNNAIVSFTNLSVKMDYLEIQGSCQILLNNSTVEITTSLKMNQYATIDFGTQSSTLTIGGELNGMPDTYILHAPASKKTQKLILKGINNLFDVFTNTGAVDGYSIVSYEGADGQTVVPSSGYATLVIAGSGSKKISGQSFNGGDVATVSKRLELKTTLKLGANDLVYKGINDSLVYKNGTAVTGWIWTDGTGVLKNSSAAVTQTFPVGDNTAMKAIDFSNINNSTGLVLSARYNAAESNVVIPHSGIGSWVVNSNNAFTADLMLIKPLPSGNTFVAPQIALSATGKIGAWNPLITSSPATNVYTAKAAVAGTMNYVSIYECPAIKISATTLPSGNQNSSYSYNSLTLSNGSAPYTLSNSTSAPADFTASMIPQTSNMVQVTGTPKTVTDYIAGFTIRDAVSCETSFIYTIKVLPPPTIWNGSSWSNGEPTLDMDAVFTGDYTTSKNSIKANNITVQSGVTITVVDNTQFTPRTLTNNGTIIKYCNGIAATSNGVITGNPITNPPITFSPLPVAVTNQPYSQTVTASITGPGAIYYIKPTNLPPGLTMTNNVLSGTPTTKGSWTFTLQYTYGQCNYSQVYTFTVIDPISPNLYINPISAKTYGDADFKLTAYSKNTAATISYSVSPTTCAQLISGDSVHISCAGPVPYNTITVTATQAASGMYKQESVTTSFFINKAPAKISIGNNAFLPNTTTNIASRKNSDGTPTFIQLSGSDLATVTGSGQVTTFANTSKFSVAVTIPATDKYTSFDSIYTFNIYPKKAAPWAINDSITIAMGQSTSINILANDLGMTDTINSTLTDIDIENAGTQKKFYSTSLGTFTIDPDGTLNIRAFDGFIGTDKIGYTVTDEYGLTSDIAYLYITVEPPFQQLELKANEVMTPNNDGLNDALVIANTDIESENKLVISDETGYIVFQQDNYRNDWEGTNTKGNKIGAGVYFYTFTEKKSGRVLQNYLQIMN